MWKLERTGPALPPILRHNRDIHILTPEKLVYIITRRGFCKEVKLPLYEYECTQCGRHIEKIQKFSDAPLTKCEKCGGKLKRLVSSSAIQFKGKGWYVTDYGRKPSTTAANSAASAGNGGKEKGPEGAKKETPPAKTSKDKPVAEKSH
jgi:putative FmdB family regulatory protein